jgi:hypothetical protein
VLLFVVLSALSSDVQNEEVGIDAAMLLCEGLKA